MREAKPNNKRYKTHRGGRKCGRKERFATEYDAAYVLRTMQEQGKALTYYYYHYRCKGFHVTSQPPGESRTIWRRIDGGRQDPPEDHAPVVRTRAGGSLDSVGS